VKNSSIARTWQAGLIPATRDLRVHQGERADAAAGKRFHSPGTNATDANDANVRGAQPFGAFAAIKARDAAEARIKVGLGAAVHNGKIGQARGMTYAN
jgi:hypothetical protein